MKDQWLYDYYIGELRRTCQMFEQHSSLLKEILDAEMVGMLNRARDYEIERMMSLCQKIRKLQTKQK